MPRHFMMLHGAILFSAAGHIYYTLVYAIDWLLLLVLRFDAMLLIYRRRRIFAALMLTPCCLFTFCATRYDAFMPLDFMPALIFSLLITPMPPLPLLRFDAARLRCLRRHFSCRAHYVSMLRYFAITRRHAFFFSIASPAAARLPFHMPPPPLIRCRDAAAFRHYFSRPPLRRCLSLFSLSFSLIYCLFRRYIRCLIAISHCRPGFLSHCFRQLAVSSDNTPLRYVISFAAMLTLLRFSSSLSSSPRCQRLRCTFSFRHAALVTLIVYAYFAAMPRFDIFCRFDT